MNYKRASPKTMPPRRKQCTSIDDPEQRTWVFTLKIMARYSSSITKNAVHKCCHPRLPRLLLQVVERPTHRKNLCRIVFNTTNTLSAKNKPLIVSAMSFSISVSSMKIYMKTCPMVTTRRGSFAPRPKRLRTTASILLYISSSIL